MNWRTVGYGLTVAALALWVLVLLVDRADWWGGAAIFAVMVALYWALGRELFGTDSS